MSDELALLEDSAEELFEDAPCGYLTTRLDGTIIKVNRTFEQLVGVGRDELLGRRRFQDLLSPGGQIYHETHYAPLLRMQGTVREIAVELVRPDGRRVPALVNSVLRLDESGTPRVVRTTVFDATDRRRYEQELLRASREEHDIALHLQRSLLSGEPPRAAGLDVHVVYHPADEGLEVGGDWYDAFWLEEDRTIGLVVGDVVGRGIGAAATMGQLRSAVRALASTGLGPAELLEALDGYAARHDVGQMATVVHAQLDLASGRLRYACAGHPPPLVLTPGAEPEFAWGGRSVPVDAYASTPARREEAVVDLAPGGSVLLYTDGLVEDRARPLAEGMDRLVTEVAARRGVGTSELAAGVVGVLSRSEHPDDVCLLAVCWDGGRG